MALAAWPLRPLEKAVHVQDALLDDLRRSRALAVEQEKRFEQLRLLPLLQDVKDQEDVLAEVGPPVKHHEDRVLNA